jgi:hypothetical protein
MGCGRLISITQSIAPHPSTNGVRPKGQDNVECMSTLPRADRRETARKARETTIIGFETVVDPEGKLSGGDRRRLAVKAYRAHMAKLASKSGRVRRQLRRERELAAEAEALASARSSCGHVWPDVLDVDSACIYCELTYGEYELPEAAS